MSRSRAQTQAAKRTAPTFAPPIPLSAGALEVWRHTLSSVASDHFATGDLRLLAIYCKTVEVLDTLHSSVEVAPDGDLSRLRAWKDVTLTVSALASKLRLAPSARNARKDAGTSPLPDSLKGSGFFGE